jgi:hypothetical protein
MFDSSLIVFNFLLKASNSNSVSIIHIRQVGFSLPHLTQVFVVLPALTLCLSKLVFSMFELESLSFIVCTLIRSFSLKLS